MDAAVLVAGRVLVDGGDVGPPALGAVVGEGARSARVVGGPVDRPAMVVVATGNVALITIEGPGLDVSMVVGGPGGYCADAPAARTNGATLQSNAPTKKRRDMLGSMAPVSAEPWAFFSFGWTPYHQHW